MKKLINNMIEAGYLSHEDEKRFDAIGHIFDYVLSRHIHGNKNAEKPSDVYYTLTHAEAITTCQSIQAWAEILIKYVRVGHFDKPGTRIHCSVCALLEDTIADMLDSDVDPYYGVYPQTHCILLSHVLAKIVTDNPLAHGALTLYFHGQFVRLGLIEPPELIG